MSSKNIPYSNSFFYEKLFTVITFCLFYINIQAQNPKREFRDAWQSTPQATKYTYMITVFDRLNNESKPSNSSTAVLVMGIEEENFSTELSQNAPNLFSDFTRINYGLAKSKNVLLTIKDLFRQDKVILVNERQSAENQRVEFINQTLNSGIDVYVLETEEGIMSRKMMAVR